MSVIQKKRFESIDLLRGFVMVIMALDHVRSYFHSDAYLFDPANLNRTTALLFFTRWVTHFCAPVFIFLSGVSAYLYGSKKSKKELSIFLFTRGIWLVLLELFVVTLAWTFNPTYPVHILQVIWATGFSMMALSAIIHLDRRLILPIALLIITLHNLLDGIQVPGDGPAAFFWSFLHQQNNFTYGHSIYMIRYPVLPWIGVITLGYYLGSLYAPDADPEMRKVSLLSLGFGAISLFLVLRSGNMFGDSAHWSVQRTSLLTVCSFINVTKYPPSLLYILMTLGPAMIFLVFAERWQPCITHPVPFRRLKKLREKITIFGRVPMIYYLAHLFLIHLLALAGVLIQGHNASDMVLSGRVNQSPDLKGFGFSLFTVYLVWALTILLLFPLCKYYDRYKRDHLRQQWWLSYL
jgi:uncharacterized membrane protein